MTDKHINPSTAAPASRPSRTRPSPPTATSTPLKPPSTSACCATSYPENGKRSRPPIPTTTVA